MNLTTAAARILDQLSDLLKQLRDEDYVCPCKLLNAATLGQHVRHVIEFFTSLEQGSKSGYVSYDKRKREEVLQTNRSSASERLARCQRFVASLRTNAPLRLEVCCGTEEGDYLVLETNLWRELVYNMEHAIHHMAMIKIGLREVAPHVSVADDFGVATSTVRHNASATAKP